MVTFATIKAKLEALRSSVNQATGGSDTTLTAAVTRLQESYSNLKSTTDADLTELDALIGGDA